MKRGVLLSISAAMLLFSLAGAVAAGAATTAQGHWEGKIKLPNRELGVTVDIARNQSGNWIGSMSILQSSAVDVPLNSVTVQDREIRFTASLPEDASFDGNLSTDGESLSGTAMSVAGKAPFELSRHGDGNPRLPDPSSKLPAKLSGVWEGVIQVEGKTAKVELRLTAAADGTAIARIVLLDLGNLEVPATAVAIDGQKIHLEMRSVSAQYSGTIGSDDTISGEWSEQSRNITLVLKHKS